MRFLRKRFVAKAITYRLLTLMVWITVIGLATGSFQLATATSLVILVIDTFIYYFHEVVWDRI